MPYSELFFDGNRGIYIPQDFAAALTGLLAFGAVLATVILLGMAA